MAEETPTRSFGNILAYQIWLTDWKEQNPDADRETTRAAWQSVKDDKTAKVKKVCRALKRKGYDVPD